MFNRKYIQSVFNILFIFSLLVILGLIFIPKRYDVSTHQTHTDVDYWDLNTGSKIAYQFIEKDSLNDNPPIIYLHGGPGAKISTNIVDQLTLLSSKCYDVYLYDQVGSGQSSRLKNIDEYTVNRHVEDLTEIINTIGSEKIIFIAQSWGSMLALQYLSKFPNQVEKLVLVGPGPILPINRELSRIESPDSLQLKEPRFSNQEGNKKAYNIRMKFVRFCAVHFGIKLASDDEVDDFFTYLLSEINKSTSCNGEEGNELTRGHGYYAHIMTLKSFHYIQDHKKQVRGNPTPTLIVKGQCDNQKWGFTEEYMSLLPNAHLEIIEGAGHIIYQEHLDELAKLVTEFLK